MCKNLLLLIPILLLVHIDLAAQYVPFEKYTPENDLVNYQVMTVFQDSIGYIWVGTKNGLARFDGNTFENFRTLEDGLLDPSILAFGEDRLGNVWVSTRKGLAKYDGKELISYPFENKILGDTKHLLGAKLVVDHSDQIFVSAKGGKSIFAFKDGEYRLFANQKTPGEKYLQALSLEPSTGRVFAFVAKQGIYELKDNQYVPILEDPDFLYLSIQSNSDQLFYAVRTASATDVYEFAAGKSVLKFSLPMVDIGWLAINNNGDFYYVQGKNVFRWEDGKAINFGTDFNRINKLYWDRENTLWLATEEGLVQYQNEAFTNFDPKESDIISYVWSIAETDNGDIWFTNYGGEMCSYDGGKFYSETKFKNQVPDCDNFYFGAIKHQNGDLLFPYNKGVVVYDGKRFYKMKKAGDQPVLELYQDPDNGILFVGTNKKVRLIYPNGKEKIFSPENGLKTGRYIIHVTKDKEGMYWLCSPDGLFRLDLENEKIKTFKIEEENLPVRGVIHSFVDHKDNLWFGTFDGLFFYDIEKETFKKVSTKAKVFYSVGFVTDLDESNLLFGVDDGIATLDLNAFYKEGKTQINFYNYRNGFKGYNSDQNGYFKDSKGNIWINSANMTVRLDPKKLGRKEKPLATSIQAVEHLDERSESGWQPATNLAAISFKMNDIRFKYKALSFTKVGVASYQYKLEGRNKDWSSVTQEESVVYNNLSPGDYSFKVRAVGNKLINEEATINFTIKPAWWHLKRVRFCLFILALLGGWFLLKSYRVRQYNERLKIEKQELEEINKENERVTLEQNMDDLKLKALHAQMNTHFLSNSLNSIQYFIYNQEADEAAQRLKDLSGLMRLFLEASIQEKITIEEELEFVRLYLEFEKLRFEERLAFDFDIHPEVDIKERIPPMLLQTFVENAIYHGILPKKTPGKVSVKIIQESEDLILCRIIDDGIGWNAAQKNNDEDNASYQSRGLEIMKERFGLIAKSKEGKIDINFLDLKDENQTGTEVQLTIYL